MNYKATADTLTDRIVALGPQVLDLADAFQLFKVPGFECRDLAPSLAQADFALSAAQAILRERAEGR